MRTLRCAAPLTPSRSRWPGLTLLLPGFPRATAVSVPGLRDIPGRQRPELQSQAAGAGLRDAPFVDECPAELDYDERTLDDYHRGGVASTAQRVRLRCAVLVLRPPRTRTDLWPTPPQALHLARSRCGPDVALHLEDVPSDDVDQLQLPPCVADPAA